SVSKKDYSFQKFLVDSTFIENIDNVYQFLSTADYINIPVENYLNYLSASFSLYKTLIQPVEEKIKDNTITVIPDGILSYIPFDALLYSYPSNIDTLNFVNLDYLIKKYTFNYSYSANLYLNRFNKEKRAGKKLLAFAPDYSTYNEFGDEEFNQLAPLTGIREEVNFISTIINSEVYINKEATESNFKENMADFDILHLAMHAIINDSLPMFSKLAFTPENSDYMSNDGWLYTSEIYNMKMKARLAVLSACNTGRGKLREGEGVISLARGFFYAGCPSIVMTLWEVEDRSGAEIMAEFYKFLKAGKKKHEALRLAKIKHIENADPVTAHPHVWLSYVNIGNTDALNTSNDLYFFIAILLILLIILADQLYKTKKARKNRA
ncbi:MAG: CHAT domain-containing protein, partial [Prolixibacteraceae bacterium]|nr:CHAT domain-containing protein [Prolixibacteraceae bacterium]